MTVDTHVYELAEAFIADSVPHPEPDLDDATHAPIVQALAEHVQQAIEDWLEAERQPGGRLA